MRERKPLPRKARPDVFDLGVAPAIDRLLRVADRRDVAEVLRRGEADEVQLDAVGVLELVDHQVTKALTAAPSKFRHALQRVDHLEEQVIEIAQPLLM